MKNDPPPETAKARPQPARTTREEALAKALRANLRRRKAPKGSGEKE